MYLFIATFTGLCACALLVASTWCPQPSALFSSSQCVVRGAVNLFHAANTTFDGTLNNLHHMALAVEKRITKFTYFAKC